MVTWRGLQPADAADTSVRATEIRWSLAAQKGDVLRLVMKEGATLVTIGTIIGFAAAWTGVRLLFGITFAMATTTGGYVAEPALWIATPVLLAGLALLACYAPARKSLRIDPMVSLRQE